MQRPSLCSRKSIQTPRLLKDMIGVEICPGVDYAISAANPRKERSCIVFHAEVI
jgi:hypothetical protein